MLESSFGLLFFQKVPEKPQKERFIYLRITVDGVAKEMSTKRKFDNDRWNQNTGRATGTKEDAKTINSYLDSLSIKIHQAKNKLVQDETTVTAQRIMDIIQGKVTPRLKVLEEFQIHNDEMFALLRTKENPKGDFAPGTHERYVTARSHVAAFIKFKYHAEDIEFRELNFQFVKDYEFWLRTVRKCCNNSALKYIANFKKIVLLAVAKQIIPTDPFKQFKSKKTKLKKKALTREQLKAIEDFEFDNQRLEIIRDTFIFQCYTGLAFIDAYKLKPCDIGMGIDGEKWIITNRQKTDADTNIPLLPKANEIIEKYKYHPECLKRRSVLPGRSNQKMNAYLKEIGDLVGHKLGIDLELHTHKGRRTFATTVTLANDVPIDTVKEMMGHESVTQTEKYAITEQEKISRNMKELTAKLLIRNQTSESVDNLTILDKIDQELAAMKLKYVDLKATEKVTLEMRLEKISKDMEFLRSRLAI